MGVVMRDTKNEGIRRRISIVGSRPWTSTNTSFSSMILRFRPLVPTLQRTLFRNYKIMTPSISPSTTDSTNNLHETIDVMASNLQKGLTATSHDFRSDTVTGLASILLLFYSVVRELQLKSCLVPTIEMLQSMFTTATFTDDIYRRDATTVKLETQVAK